MIAHGLAARRAPDRIRLTGLLTESPAPRRGSSSFERPPSTRGAAIYRRRGTARSAARRQGSSECAVVVGAIAILHAPPRRHVGYGQAAGGPAAPVRPQLVG